MNAERFEGMCCVFPRFGLPTFLASKHLLLAAHGIHLPKDHRIAAIHETNGDHEPCGAEVNHRATCLWRDLAIRFDIQVQTAGSDSEYAGEEEGVAADIQAHGSPPS